LISTALSVQRNPGDTTTRVSWKSQSLNRPRRRHPVASELAQSPFNRPLQRGRATMGPDVAQAQQLSWFQ
jgi:hypothetical protein